MSLTVGEPFQPGYEQAEADAPMRQVRIGSKSLAAEQDVAKLVPAPIRQGAINSDHEILEKEVVMSTTEGKHQQSLQYYQLGYFNDAVGLLGEMLGEQQTSELWNDWAAAQLARGRIAEAEMGFRRALDCDPRDAQAAVNLGAALVKNGRSEAAVRLFENALQGNHIDSGQRAVVAGLLAQCHANLTREGGSKATSRARRPDPSQIQLSDCFFYHSMTFPDGSKVLGDWDLGEESFSDYIGNIDVRGKTLLDVGTATGFIAFQAERRGAKVTAYDLDGPASVRLVPSNSTKYHTDHAAWEKQCDDGIAWLTNGFWYAHHRMKSNVRAVYCALAELPDRIPEMDIVIAGAFFEHISDPVSAIGFLSRIAKETLVFAFTPVIESDDLFLKMYPSEHPWSWFTLSTGLLRHILEKVGFRITKIGSSRQYARFCDQWFVRPTIVAERTPPRAADQSTIQRPLP